MCVRKKAKFVGLIYLKIFLSSDLEKYISMCLLNIRHFIQMQSNWYIITEIFIMFFFMMISALTKISSYVAKSLVQQLVVEPMFWGRVDVQNLQ